MSEAHRLYQGVIKALKAVRDARSNQARREAAYELREASEALAAYLERR